MDLTTYCTRAIEAIQAWETTWGDYDRHPSLAIDEGRLREALDHYTHRLRGNYPFFHPRYAGQMLKPPHPAAIVGYLAAMCINPNNHALDGGPPTGQMEKEVVRDLAAMVRFPDDALGHLTSGGTIANLEALWVARELHPDRTIAFSEAAHYTHGRMCGVLNAPTTTLPTDAHHRLDLDALEEALQKDIIGTLVVTAGTTGIGAVDPIAEAVALCRRYGCRLHVDAAYGGFFTLLAWADDAPLRDDVRQAFRAIAQADSVAIDPHKHGLQPYGCGSVLFRDAAVGRFYQHDSPYTYFTSDELHLGEISLECSRAGAAAGAFWFTTQLLPLRADEGLGPVLAACLRAAQTWHAKLDASDGLHPYQAPDLDIVTFFPVTDPLSASRIDAASQRLFEQAMDDPDDPLFLSVLRAESADLHAQQPTLTVDQPQARILRSVLMKPEHETYVDALHERVETLVASLESS
jgi:glutamate/tyrosine decarboxylase-like PLP-dependent enzyme